MKLTTLFILLALVVGYSCSKNNIDTSLPVKNDFSVTDTWEATVDGVNYNGTIDTSFLHISPNSGSVDTVVYCTGTSFDKKANISFKIRFNRTASLNDSVITATGYANFTFDTSSNNYLRSYLTTLANLTFRLDSVNETKIKGRFYGKVYDPKTMGPVIKEVANGRFSFNLFKGRNEPKTFSISVPDAAIPGYIKYARHVSNTLILDGFTYSGDTTFQLMIRTGSKITTGTFFSRNGDVGLQVYRPSFYPYYVNDTLGNLTVQIINVSGNIVEGMISGTSRQSFSYPEIPFTNGRFRCRVKNYIPGQDSINKWKFCDENGINLFSTYAGNIIGAERRQVGIKYFLKINGESDNGLSSFKISLSSYSPLTTGVYQGSGYPQSLDTFSFRSPVTSYFRDRSNMFVVIDSLDNQKVVGKFYETDPSGGVYTIQGVRKGYFRANF